ncbi:unnamed protein product [Triticum turgidum subsp. durum]|uniref:Uncharacterized protein n=1 Tax=Triticum turgidum subsp. durum TaxID=4567 RepID=A0A9R0ZS69_TRITD|nr:unnamed protein product [Triticum turgidum subsp. durum]
MQLPSSSSLQELAFKHCKGLVLVPVENGGGIQEDKSLLQSLTIFNCGRFFCRWPMGKGESETIFKSMALLSNLTSLTRLRIHGCSNLTVAGFNPLIAVNLIELQVYHCNTSAADLLSEVASQRAKLLPAGYISRLESLPQGLHRLSSLKELCVRGCPNIRSMPKEGLPVSLRKLRMDCHSAEIEEQIEKIKRTNPNLSVKG